MTGARRATRSAEKNCSDARDALFGALGALGALGAARAMERTSDASSASSDEDEFAASDERALLGRGASSVSARETFRKHGRTLAAFAATLVATTMSMSVPFPFLGMEFARSGVSPRITGLVFAALPLGVLCVSPYAPTLSWKMDPKMVATRSLLGQGVCVFATTLAGRARWRVWFACRFCQGCFNAVTSVTMLCVVTRAAPEAVALCSGIQEVAAGFGTLVGPIFGGFLFDVWGSPTLPLVVNGIAILAAVPAVELAMSSIDSDTRTGSGAANDEDDKPSYARVLRHPTFLSAMLAELVVSTSFGGIPTTMPLYLHQTLRFSPSMVGVVYSLLAGLYASITPLVGMVSHNSRLADIMLCLIGMAAMAMAHMLFGPSSLLDLPSLSDNARRRLCVWGASVIYGVGSAFAFVPFLPIMQASVQKEGPKYADLANGLFLSVYFFGEMLGQLCSSSFVHKWGYPAVSTGWALLILFSASGLVVVQFGAGIARKVKQIRGTVSRIASTSSIEAMML